MAAQASDMTGGAHRPHGKTQFGSIAAATIGGGLTAALLAFVLDNPSETSSESSLSTVAPGEISDAAHTLNSNWTTQLVSQAKNCTAPLAHLTIVKGVGGAGGKIRIRSGGYLSPVFDVPDTPRRIAIPFPAPYPTGRGALVVEGEAKGANISLFPVWRIESLIGSAVRNVVWNPAKPC